METSISEETIQLYNSQNITNTVQCIIVITSSSLSCSSIILDKQCSHTTSQLCNGKSHAKCLHQVMHYYINHCRKTSECMGKRLQMFSHNQILALAITDHT